VDEVEYGGHWSSLPHYEEDSFEELDNDEEPTPTIPEEYQIIEEEEYEVGPDSLPDEDFIEYLDSLPDEDEELEEWEEDRYFGWDSLPPEEDEGEDDTEVHHDDAGDDSFLNESNNDDEYYENE